MGQTALHIAARVGNAECVRCVLLSGADTELLNKVNVKQYALQQVLRGARKPVWRDRFLTQLCPRLMDNDRRCGGSAFQTAGTPTLKLRRPSCVLVERTIMLWRSAERRFARPEM